MLNNVVSLLKSELVFPRGLTSFYPMTNMKKILRTILRHTIKVSKPNVRGRIESLLLTSLVLQVFEVIQSFFI